MIELKQGDCLELLKLLADKSIDCVITDPPYQAHFEKGGGAFGQRQYFEDIDEGVGSNLNFDIKPFLEAIKPKLKIFNAYFWCSQRQIQDYLAFATDNKLHFDILIWSKTNPLPTKNNKYLPDLEYCVFMRETGAYWNNDLIFDSYRKLFVTAVNKSEWGHPTEKPLNIIRTNMEVSTRGGDLVLDPFLGSGTTGVAAQQLGRNFIGYELSPTYFEIAKKRIDQAKRQVQLGTILD